MNELNDLDLEKVNAGKGGSQLVAQQQGGSTSILGGGVSVNNAIAVGGRGRSRARAGRRR